MSEEQSGPMILAIGTENDFLHVYYDDQKLLQDHKIGAGAGEIAPPLEFFDSEGYRLAGKYDRQWQLLGLTRTDEPPNLALVRWRVQKTFEYLRSYIERNQDKVDLQDLTLEDALECIPNLAQSSDFDKFLRALAHREGEIGTKHSGDPVHNWWHACGGKH